MARAGLVGLIVMFSVGGPVAAAHTRTGAVVAGEFTLINRAGVPEAQIAAFVEAFRVQAKQLAADWQVPTARFGHNGWKVWLLRPGAPPLAGYLGLHDSYRWPFGYVAYTPSWSVIASHEMLEMLVDPWTDRLRHRYRLEVCDPVKTLTYTVDGVQLSDFVTPAWFGGHTGPYDYLARATSPFSVQFGYAQRLDPQSGYVTLGSGPSLRPIEHVQRKAGAVA